MTWFEFRESFATEDHVVFGRRLKPFCLYYQFWLSSIESPILSGEQVSITDLELAVRICSADYGKAPKSVPTKVSLFGHLVWWWRLLRYNPSTEFKKFQNYLEDQFAPPEVKSTGGDKTVNKGGSQEMLPSELSLACSVIKHTGWCEDKVWTMPLGRAYWYSAGFNCLESPDFKLVTQEDKDHVAAIKRLQEQGILPTQDSPVRGK